MKDIYSLLIIISLVSIALFSQSQTQGNLSVTITTSDAGGSYQPRHIVAVWIEDADGNFVKTLMAYANNRITHLNTWQESTSNAGEEFNTVDAITGATQNSHTTRNCTWDGTDYLGSLVDDGDYKIRMELTDKNATGNYSSFTFAKGENDVTLTPDNEPSFSDISIEWVADVSALEDNYVGQMLIYPNPGNGMFKINAQRAHHTSVYNAAGQLIYQTDKSIADISSCASGIYLVNIEVNGNSRFFRYIKSE